MSAESFNVLAICGSPRAESYNKKLLNFALARLNVLGVKSSTIEITNDKLPVFYPGIPVSKETGEIVDDLRNKVRTCNGVIICTPQVNGSIPPFLKNIIDWTTMPFEGQCANGVFKTKLVCLLGAAQGNSTCLGGLAHLATVFGHLGSVVVPQFYGVTRVETLFSSSGDIADAKTADGLQKYLESFSLLLKKF
jgi:chromate reductase